MNCVIVICGMYNISMPTALSSVTLCVNSLAMKWFLLDCGCGVVFFSVGFPCYCVGWICHYF